MAKEKTSIRNQIRTLRFQHGEMTQQALADQIGVTRQTMQEYLEEWIPALGSFAKKNLVFLPKMETIVACQPQSFLDCGMKHVVAIGDCKDHRVQTDRASLVGSLGGFPL